MGSLRQLHTRLDFEIEPFLEKYLKRRGFSQSERGEFQGWIKLKYLHDKKGIDLIISLLWGKAFSVSSGSLPYFIETSQSQSKEHIVKALKTLLSHLSLT
jgi:hypothetical protein